MTKSPRHWRGPQLPRSQSNRPSAECSGTSSLLAMPSQTDLLFYSQFKLRQIVPRPKLAILGVGPTTACPTSKRVCLETFIVKYIYEIKCV